MEEYDGKKENASAGGRKKLDRTDFFQSLDTNISTFYCPLIEGEEELEKVGKVPRSKRWIAKNFEFYLTGAS